MTFFLLSFILLFLFVWMIFGIDVMYDIVRERPPESIKQYIVILFAIGPLGTASIATIITCTKIICLLGVLFNRLGKLYNATIGAALGKLYNATIGAANSMISDKIRNYYNRS